MTMIDTLELYEELSTAMDAKAARVLAGAMGKLYREIAATVTKEEFTDLKAIVADLAEAQKRTEARVEELAEAQKRTEARVEELAEAQKRTEEEVRQLAKGLRDTRQMVGGLSDTVGYVLEDRAIHSLPDILAEEAGVTVEGGLERSFIQHADGRTSELNIFGHGTKATGDAVTILGEAKARLSPRHVDGLLRLARRLREEGLLEGEPLLLLVTYSATPRAAEHARAKGVLVVPSYKLGP